MADTFTAPTHPNIGRQYSVPETVTVNGVRHELDIDARTTSLDLLRERLLLTGAKKGCNRGECGTCTVIRNGRRVNGRMILVGSLDGDELITIEGLAKDPVQQAFVDDDAFQCGFCTPGQVLSAVGCVSEGTRAMRPRSGRG
jgi:xanthine dehydrogenase YagT iron-sulfur-binding subunit